MIHNEISICIQRSNHVYGVPSSLVRSNTSTLIGGHHHIDQSADKVNPKKPAKKSYHKNDTHDYIIYRFYLYFMEYHL